MISVTFKLGTNLDTAQVLTQNRVAVALPRLPDAVQRLGVTVIKSSPDLMMVIHLRSPNHSRDQLYLSNYATLHVQRRLARLDGVGDVQVFGGRDYAMRIWLDPDKVAAHDLTAGEVIAALQAQNVQISSGVLGQPPVPQPGAFQLNVQTLGRLVDPAQFADIIVKTDAAGRITRVARHRPGRAGRAGLRLARLPGRGRCRAPAGLPAARLQRARHRAARPRRHGGAGEGPSPTASASTSSTTPPASSRSRCTRW